MNYNLQTKQNLEKEESTSHNIYIKIFLDMNKLHQAYDLSDKILKIVTFELSNQISIYRSSFFRRLTKS